MNQDPVYQKLQEISWRRPLTEAEQAELRAWLLTHPEAQAEVEADGVLNAAIIKLPDAPMPSNFTARVMQAVELEARQNDRVVRPPAFRWRIFLPRMGVVCAVVVGGLFVWQQQAGKQEQLVKAARDVASAQLLSDPIVLNDFEVIASLTPAEIVADDGLLSMSEDLLAIGK